jgi:hypothetical protein
MINDIAMQTFRLLRRTKHLVLQPLNRLLPVLILMALHRPAAGEPVPIIQDASGQWIRSPGTPFPVSNIKLDLRRFAQLPNQVTLRAQATKIVHAPGDDRLIAVNALNSGALFTIDPDGSNVTLLWWPALQYPGGQYRGTKDITFHPQFNQPGAPGYGKVYLLLTVTKPADATGLTYIGPPESPYGDNLLSEYNAVFNDQGQIIGVDGASRRDLFRIGQFRSDHPAGEMGFNPFAKPGDEDYGLLYVTVGDSLQYLDGGPVGTNALGKTLRINPLQDGSLPYSVPADNPFVGDPNVLDEIWSMGHRNNHVMTFAQDNQGKGVMLIAEIGEGTAEEVNLISEGGHNYGWPYMEGTITDIPNNNADSYVYPIAQFGQNGAQPQAISGGYVIDNGSPLAGQYFLTDFAVLGDTFTFNLHDALDSTVLTGPLEDIRPADIARVGFLFDDDDNPATPSVEMSLHDIITTDPNYDGSGRLDIRYGQGPRGEIYIVNKRNGWVYLVSNSLPAASSTADFDGDGDVDGADFLVWQRGAGAGTTKLEGDANGDQVVDAADLTIWRAEFGYPNQAASQPTPEPSSAAMLAAASIAALGAARQRNLSLRAELS